MSENLPWSKMHPIHLLRRLSIHKLSIHSIVKECDVTSFEATGDTIVSFATRLAFDLIKTCVIGCRALVHSVAFFFRIVQNDNIASRLSTGHRYSTILNIK